MPNVPSCVELPKNQNLSQTLLRRNLFDVCCIEKSRGGVEGWQTSAVNCCNCVCDLCHIGNSSSHKVSSFSSGELGKFDI